VFFFTSVISVVTGSTSLITVPVMIALGIEAHVAVATNIAIDVTKKRLGTASECVRWSVGDLTKAEFALGVTMCGTGLVSEGM
jgi:uncharacterized membrane protein YfcA